MQNCFSLVDNCFLQSLLVRSNFRNTFAARPPREGRAAFAYLVEKKAKIMADAKVFKAWQREWALIRREFLAGKLPVPVVAQVTSSKADGYRWECPECGAVGTALRSESRAESMGNGHVQTHAKQEHLDALEDIKVLRMPEELLTRYQRDKRDELLESGRND